MRVFDAKAFDSLRHQTIGGHHGRIVAWIFLGIVVEANVATLRIALDELLKDFICEATLAIRARHIAEACYPERQRIDNPFAENDCVGRLERFRVPYANMRTFEIPVTLVFRCASETTALDFTDFVFTCEHWERNATA